MIVPFVPQATTFIAYTPAAGLVPYTYCTFFLEEDSTISFTDKDGNASASVLLKAGYHPILVSKITAMTPATTGKVFILKHQNLG